jgi:hypothetical protein
MKRPYEAPLWSAFVTVTVAATPKTTVVSLTSHRAVGQAGAAIHMAAHRLRFGPPSEEGT